MADHLTCYLNVYFVRPAKLSGCFNCLEVFLIYFPLLLSLSAEVFPFLLSLIKTDSFVVLSFFHNACWYMSYSFSKNGNSHCGESCTTWQFLWIRYINGFPTFITSLKNQILHWATVNKGKFDIQKALHQTHWI